MTSHSGFQAFKNRDSPNSSAYNENGDDSNSGAMNTSNHNNVLQHYECKKGLRRVTGLTKQELENAKNLGA